MKRTIKVVLDKDTAEFLAASRADKRPEAVSAFINSLLRQENFRQGDLLGAMAMEPIASQPIQSARHDAALRRNGLIPFRSRRR